jgi:hypothetical protein
MLYLHMQMFDMEEVCLATIGAVFFVRNFGCAFFILHGKYVSEGVP